LLCSDPFEKTLDGNVVKAGKYAITQPKLRMLFPCGQCFNCRINQSRVWKNRLLLESKFTKYSYFITLTYAQHHLPTKLNKETGELEGVLVKKHHQTYIKRLRKNLGIKLRYYVVGEYGENNWRPHFHIAIFTDTYIPEIDFKVAWSCPKCGYEQGFIHVGDIANGSAAYMAKYMQKKATKSYYTVLGERPPEYANMSTHNGGIGIGVIEEMAKTLKKNNVETTEIRDCVHIGKKPLPIGRYLTKKLAQKLDIPEKEFTKRFYQLLDEYDKTFNMDDPNFVVDLLDRFKGKRDSAINKQNLFTAKRRLG
jgi:hypothetical protein